MQMPVFMEKKIAQDALVYSMQLFFQYMLEKHAENLHVGDCDENTYVQAIHKLWQACLLLAACLFNLINWTKLGG